MSHRIGSRLILDPDTFPRVSRVKCDPFLWSIVHSNRNTALLANEFSVGSFVLIVFVTAAGASLGKLVIYAGGKDSRESWDRIRL